MSLASQLLGGFPEDIQPHLKNACDDLEACLANHEQAKKLKNTFSDKTLCLQCLKLLATSDYATQQFIRHPEFVVDGFLNKSFYQAFEPADESAWLTGLLKDKTTEADFNKALRLYRHKSIIRILFRDVNQLDSTQETLAALSQLAELCIQTAVTYHTQGFEEEFGNALDNAGTPQSLLTIAMGKLGGQELNFSSDIDVIFAYASAGETQGGKRNIEHQAYFSRIAQKVIASLNQATADGFVYRVDTRLRPYGDSGPIVMSLPAMEIYYQSQARDWERYAMVKARLVTGNENEQAAFQAIQKPFVYRRYIDFGVIESLRQMKALVAKEVTQKGFQDHIKLGPGGIREVEFLVQMQQLIHGGKKVALQTPSLYQAFDALKELGLYAHDTIDTLIQNYEFLRLAENHLQAYKDQQNHQLPQNELAQSALATSLDYPNWQALKTDITAACDKIELIFSSITLDGPTHETAEKNTGTQWLEMTTKGDQVPQWLQHYEDAETLLNLLQHIKKSRTYAQLNTQNQKRFDGLMEQLLIEAKAFSEQSFRRLLRLMDAIAGRAPYLALLSENPRALKRLAELFDKSNWIAEQIRLHPLLLDEVLDSRQLYAPFERSALETELNAHLKGYHQHTEAQMEVLRQFKLSRHLRTAAAEVMKNLHIMKASDALTFTAEVITEAALTLAWQDVASQYGAPAKQALSGFGLIAYGKLGGLELSYQSDLDLVFLVSDKALKGSTEGENSRDNSFFYNKVIQKFLHYCHTTTHSGKLYEVDTRLRPSGSAGLMVSSVNSFEKYQQSSAWTWEHQALVRARFICGDSSIELHFNDIRQKVLCQKRHSEELKKSIVEMRQKMSESTMAERKTLSRQIKHQPGGLIDIEFLVQYLVLKHAHQYPDLATYSDNIRQLDALRDNKILKTEEADSLQEAYLSMRQITHWCALNKDFELDKKDGITLEHNRDVVTGCWQANFE